MASVNINMEILRKKQKEIVEIKNTVTEMESTFDELMNRLSMTEERITELEDMSTETSQTKKQEKTDWRQ